MSHATRTKPSPPNPIPTLEPAGPERQKTNPTIDLSALAADSLEVGLAAAFGKSLGPPRSSLGNLRRMLLKEAEGESSLVVKPTSDAIPLKEEAGDRYRFDGEIARGGMGAVLRVEMSTWAVTWRSRCCSRSSPIAPTSPGGSSKRPRLAGSFSTPAWCRSTTSAQFGDRPFFTMKLVKGQTLAAILSERDRGIRRPAAAAGHRLAGVAGDGVCPRQGGHSPRPQAGEHHGRGIRRGPGDGLGAGQGAGRGRHSR